MFDHNLCQFGREFTTQGKHVGKTVSTCPVLNGRIVGYHTATNCWLLILTNPDESWFYLMADIVLRVFLTAEVEHAHAN